MIDTNRGIMAKLILRQQAGIPASQPSPWRGARVGAGGLMEERSVGLSDASTSANQVALTLALGFRRSLPSSRLSVFQQNRPEAALRAHPLIYPGADVGHVCGLRADQTRYDNSSSSALASLRSLVSKPSVNQP